jgi:hypothetical protein
METYAINGVLNTELEKMNYNIIPALRPIPTVALAQ